MNYIKSISLSIFTLLFIISCNQFGDNFKLPGENPKDIIYFELDNDYLAPESKEFIETNFSSNNVNTSYVLIGKKTYGFEADLDNQMSLSFDEDGNYKLDRDHPFLKDNYKKGKFNNSDSDKREDKDKEDQVFTFGKVYLYFCSYRNPFIEIESQWRFLETFSPSYWRKELSSRLKAG